jgi:hypothetical protein
MATSTALPPSVRAALGALIDYAGLFPPAQLSLAQAASEYRAARAGAHAWMLGRFILPAQLLTEAASTIEGPLSVIVEPNVDALETVANARREGLKIEALEVPLAKTVSPHRERLSRDEILDAIGALEADICEQGLRDVPAFLEIPGSAPWRDAVGETLEAVARFGLNAKFRCGGVTEEAFPSVEELADVIAAAVAAHVPFKATAGLHHPVRHRDAATGFMMHGFLNLIAAASLAPQVDSETLESIVAEEEPGAFRFGDESFSWRHRSLNLDELTRTRAGAFVSYGSCSFSEPVDDLAALGILPPR